MNIIFHHPLPLNSKASSASGIRPLKMLEAFKSLGYQVDVISGYSSERKVAIKSVKERINSGVLYDFVYSESSTMPTVLTDRSHLPFHPFLDFSFFCFCNKNNIPIGLFYRDVYWKFSGYGESINPLKVLVAKFFYYYDLFFYKKTLTKLYLPSLKMGEYIPIVDQSVHSALPPGHSNINLDVFSKKNKIYGNRKLKFFYVGGLSNHYQMHKVFEVLKDCPDVEFTLCTREQEWTSQKDNYPTLSSNIKVVHESGDEMSRLLLDSDIVSLYVKPQKYWEFAAPVKLYEYLGYGKPIVASVGTMAGEFVKENNIGWTIPYEHESLVFLLKQLVSSPELLEPVIENMKKVALNHTWQARARQVAADLKGNL